MTDWLEEFEDRVEVAMRYDERCCLEPEHARELIDAMKIQDDRRILVESINPLRNERDNLHLLLIRARGDLRPIRNLVDEIEKALEKLERP